MKVCRSWRWVRGLRSGCDHRALYQHDAIKSIKGVLKAAWVSKHQNPESRNLKHQEHASGWKMMLLESMQLAHTNPSSKEELPSYKLLAKGT